MIRLSNLFFLLTGVMIVLYITAFFVPGLIPASLRRIRPNAVATASATSSPAAALTSSTPTLTAEPTASALSPTETEVRTPTGPRASSTPIESNPTNTRTSTPTPTITPTPTATETGTPTSTPTQSRYLYTVQRGYPRYSAYPGGCNWMGFSGEVFDLEGKPVIDVVVHIGGADHLVLSGSSQLFGIRGWVDQVAARPAATNGFYTVQLQDAVGNPLSDAISLGTFNDCAQNLGTLNFAQNH